MAEVGKRSTVGHLLGEWVLNLAAIIMVTMYALLVVFVVVTPLVAAAMKPSVGSAIVALRWLLACAATAMTYSDYKRGR